MIKLLKQKYNLLLFFLYILLLVSGAIFINNLKTKNINGYINRENNELASRIETQIDTLFKEKQDTTLAMAISLAQNTLFKEALSSDIAKEIDLKQVSLDYSLNTTFDTPPHK